LVTMHLVVCACERRWRHAGRHREDSRLCRRCRDRLMVPALQELLLLHKQQQSAANTRAPTHQHFAAAVQHEKHHAALQLQRLPHAAPPAAGCACVQGQHDVCGPVLVVTTWPTPCAPVPWQHVWFAVRASRACVSTACRCHAAIVAPRCLLTT
jgi:hypothetical protein